MDVGFNGDVDKKILDAGCGSGGFLVEAINKIKEANKDKSKQEVLSKIINNVVGFDVNPVAVLTARTNYLLAISPLLKDKNNPIQITIPIYLADAIITPTREGQKKLVETDSYLISTVEGVFALPKDFVDSGYLNDGMRIVEECLESDYPTEDFKILFQKKINISDNEIKVVIDFYNRIKELHKQDKNRIWVKIIQNSFAPLLHTEFDYVVGNPPWIKWDFLSKDYKKKLNHLYLDIYKLFSHKGMKAGLGYSHDDISVMFMYVAIDKYLKKGGRLGFVMKQTLYKSLAGNEFRKFEIEKTSQKPIPLKVIKVNDMLELKPFNTSAQAETSTVILEKGEKTKYPVAYSIWKSTDGLPKENEFLSEILSKIEITQREAYPHNEKDLTDIWITVDKGEKKTKFVKGKNYYQSRHGLVNDLNSVFFIDILDKQGKIITIKNRTARAKKKLPTIKTKIENDLVYPFLKPRNVKKWGMQGYIYGILPQKKNGEKNESELRTNQPLTYKYLHNFKPDLLNRSSKWFKTKGIPFYSFFGLGDYSFAPYKIVWCCMSYQPSFSVVSKVNDKNIGNKEVMPDNTIGYFSVKDKQEAYYMCSILNSKTTKKFFESRSSKSKWGISINMVDSIPIKKFDKNNKIHKKLAELGEKAHNTKNEKELKEIEQKIDELSEEALK